MGLLHEKKYNCRRCENDVMDPILCKICAKPYHQACANAVNTSVTASYFSCCDRRNELDTYVAEVIGSSDNCNSNEIIQSVNTTPIMPKNTAITNQAHNETVVSSNLSLDPTAINNIHSDIAALIKQNINSLQENKRLLSEVMANMNHLSNQFQRIDTTLQSHSDDLACLKTQSATNTEVLNSVMTRLAKVESSDEATDFQSSHGMDSVISEVHRRISADNNLLMFGIPEQSNDTEDFHHLKGYLNLIKLNIREVSFYRLGPYTQGYCRPIMLRLRNRTEVDRAIRNYRSLPSGVTISRDRTKQQREQFKKLKEEVTTHNKNYPHDPKKVIFIESSPTVVPDSLPLATGVTDDSTPSNSMEVDNQSASKSTSQQRSRPLSRSLDNLHKISTDSLIDNTHRFDHYSQNPTSAGSVNGGRNSNVRRGRGRGRPPKTHVKSRVIHTTTARSNPQPKRKYDRLSGSGQEQQDLNSKRPTPNDRK